MHSEEFKRKGKPGLIMRLIVVNWRRLRLLSETPLFRQLELVWLMVVGRGYKSWVVGVGVGVDVSNIKN